MRRSDHDVADSVRTTDPTAVAAEVIRLARRLYPDAPTPALERAFTDAGRMYRGEHRDYRPCDTEYHDIQHVLDVTLAMARLMDGYQRGGRNGYPALGKELFLVGILAALFHDFGYLRRRNDRKHRNGAEYTLIHVSRGATFLRGYLRDLGVSENLAGAASTLVNFTGYERAVDTIRLPDEALRRTGLMLGTADIIAQMSDRCYLEKCRDRLYPEFVLGKLGGFSSAEDLVLKTPRFYEGACRRLDDKLGRSYEYAARHFGGPNLYLDEMRKNIDYAQQVAKSGEVSQRLRRRPPKTLVGL
ncbi:MAG TPA: HD domain-containing protein [Burkholderiales bacterium]|nr:HD domain-containing protein [Burkholderiales bacterium]